jgi:hypothetical protein
MSQPIAAGRVRLRAAQQHEQDAEARRRKGKLSSRNQCAKARQPAQDFEEKRRHAADSVQRRVTSQSNDIAHNVNSLAPTLRNSAW